MLAAAFELVKLIVKIVVLIILIVKNRYKTAMKNLPTELLRAFVTVIELGGFTQAAEWLGRSQPAVSLQIKRLEQLL